MTTIDTPEFDLALEQDASGEFHRSVQEFLSRSLADVRQQLQRGLSPLEFEQAKKIETALERATDVIRFSAAQISSRSVQPITS
ncbi:MAG TPA: EscE/YscE/SsaE family type III secretion system needle protein co-chaperone [Opitutaceae bacterium]|jgi:hypothetical protein|nr:hypothetical protein [Opitutaceae bacterium]HRE08794.1 EscE/YscE/SsaE family type III secretion system needle protein co-chaperone [Opitutaceae bacterium]